MLEKEFVHQDVSENLGEVSTVEQPWDNPSLFYKWWGSREPFLPCSRGIVSSIFAKYPPQEGPLMEIGSGGGTFRAYIPEALKPRLSHTEPGSRLRELHQMLHPEAAVLEGTAYDIPAESNSLGGVMDLSAYDVLDNPTEARDEIHRVLSVGGRFFHFLDMLPFPREAFAFFRREGLIGFPNFLHSEEVASYLGERNFIQHFPETEYGDDFLTIPRASFQTALATLLQSSANPPPEIFFEYLNLFAYERDDEIAVKNATTFFNRMRHEPQLLKEVCLCVMEVMLQPAVFSESSFSLQPFNSAQHHLETMKVHFEKNEEFSIECSRLISAQAAVSRSGENPTIAYRRGLVGKLEESQNIPPEIFRDLRGVFVAQGKTDEAIEILLQEIMIIEAAVGVFVAQKIA